MVISVDILMVKVNWEGVFRGNGVFLYVYVCVFGDIFYSCEIVVFQLFRGYCFRIFCCQFMVGKGLIYWEMQRVCSFNDFVQVKVRLFVRFFVLIEQKIYSIYVFICYLEEVNLLVLIKWFSC